MPVGERVQRITSGFQLGVGAGKGMVATARLP